MGELASAVPVVELGSMLGRYELLATVARGGMATVWLARLSGTHGFEKLVAVKTILTNFAADEAFRSMFLDEARLASRIEHPNVVQILDLGEEHGELFLVMEYVDGDSLRRLHRATVKSGRLIPLPITLRILCDVCSGLHAAHDLVDDDGRPLGLVHRDVSPHNVLVSTAGIAKVIDFGVAKARNRVGEETSAGMMKGKIAYMAPEQVMGGDVDRRADIWAVGAMAYELITGQSVFPAEGDVDRLRKVVAENPPDRVPGTPSSVEKVIIRALTRDRAARFATAAQMRDALEEALFEMRARCSHDDVRAFVMTHLPDAASGRKAVIDRALSAAAERKRMRELLSADPPGSSSGQVIRPAGLARVSEAPGVVPVPQPEPVRGWSKRAKWIVTGAAAGLGVLALAGLAVLASRPARVPAAPPVAPSESARSALVTVPSSDRGPQAGALGPSAQPTSPPSQSAGPTASAGSSPPRSPPTRTRSSPPKPSSGSSHAPIDDTIF